MDKELENAEWRRRESMTNRKYLKRRNFDFFSDSFSNLNNIDRRATLGQLKMPIGKRNKKSQRACKLPDPLSKRKQQGKAFDHDELTLDTKIYLF